MRVGKIPRSNPANVAVPEDSSFVLLFQSSVDNSIYFKNSANAVTAVGSGGAPGTMAINGALDLTANPDYPAGVKGVVYTVSNPGKIGGTNGVYGFAGALVICQADGVGGDQAAAGLRWTLINWAGNDWQIGPDQFARPQQRYIAVNSVLRMGAWGADGDATTVNTEGAVWYGVNALGVQSAAEGGYARVKPDRFGLGQIITGINGDNLFYYFRADKDGIVVRNNSAVITFEVSKERGTMRTSKGVSAARPAAVNVGEQWFDTALGANGGKPIWFVGGGLWVDASGALV